MKKSNFNLKLFSLPQEIQSLKSISQDELIELYLQIAQRARNQKTEIESLKQDLKVAKIKLEYSTELILKIMNGPAEALPKLNVVHVSRN